MKVRRNRAEVGAEGTVCLLRERVEQPAQLLDSIDRCHHEIERR